MKYNPDIHHRRSIRLKGYDYSGEGWYFITICTHNQAHLFGKIEKGEMMLNDAGRMVEQQWREMVCHFQNIRLHECIVMPNHFHGIVEFVVTPLAGVRNGGQPQTGQPQGIAPTVGDVVGAFKSITSNDYIRNVKQNNWQPFAEKLWQRNYYEHIIRDQQSYVEIAEYIQTNHLKWLADRYYG
ncbi:MAG: transposase [Deltaproteobacteria bacterium]|nr:transposase [Deltaproteobacteria bacterium]